MKLENTHRIRTHAVLRRPIAIPNQNRDLSTPKPCHLYPEVILYTKFEHFGIIQF